MFQSHVNPHVNAAGTFNFGQPAFQQQLFNSAPAPGQAMPVGQQTMPSVRAGQVQTSPSRPQPPLLMSFREISSGKMPGMQVYQQNVPYASQRVVTTQAAATEAKIVKSNEATPTSGVLAMPNGVVNNNGSPTSNAVIGGAQHVDAVRTSTYLSTNSTPQAVAHPTQLIQATLTPPSQNWNSMLGTGTGPTSLLHSVSDNARKVSVSSDKARRRPSGNINKMDKTREHELLSRISELEHRLREKSQIIVSLQAELKKTGMPLKLINQKSRADDYGSAGRGFGHAVEPKLPQGPTTLKPNTPYHCYNRHDPIDVKLEEFYNATNSAIPFVRINKGWYKFGTTEVELEIINQKLMAKTDEGWNRGKYGDWEKFVVTFEPIEREKAGVPFE